MMKKWMIVGAMFFATTQLSAETVGNKLGDAYQTFVAMTKEKSVQDVLTPGQQMFLKSLGKTVEKDLGDVSKDQLEGVVFKLGDFASVVGDALKKSNKTQVATTVDSSVSALKSQIEGLLEVKKPKLVTVTTNQSGQPVLHVQGVSGQTDSDTLEMSDVTDEELTAMYGDDLSAFSPRPERELENPDIIVTNVDELDTVTGEPVLIEADVRVDLPMYESLFPSEDEARSESVLDLLQGPDVKHRLDIALEENALPARDEEAEEKFEAQIRLLDRLDAAAAREEMEKFLPSADSVLLEKLIDAIIRIDVSKKLREMDEDEELLSTLTPAETAELAAWIEGGMSAQQSATKKRSMDGDAPSLKCLRTEPELNSADVLSNAQRAIDKSVASSLLRDNSDHQSTLENLVATEWQKNGQRLLNSEGCTQVLRDFFERSGYQESQYGSELPALVAQMAAIQEAMIARKVANEVVDTAVSGAVEDYVVEGVVQRAFEKASQRIAAENEAARTLLADTLVADVMSQAVGEAIALSEAKRAAEAEGYENFLTNLGKAATSTPDEFQAFIKPHESIFQKKIERLVANQKRHLTVDEFKRHVLADLKKYQLSEKKFETAVAVLAQHLFDLQAAKRVATSKYFTENPLSIGGRPTTVQRRPILGGKELSTDAASKILTRRPGIVSRRALDTTSGFASGNADVD